MSKNNISQAAKMTGKTRTTIYKKIKSGELSAELGEDGNRLIDTAELLRVFGDLVTPDTVSMDVHTIHSETPQVTPLLERQISLLEAENKRLHEQMASDRGKGTAAWPAGKANPASDSHATGTHAESVLLAAGIRHVGVANT